MLTLFVCLFVWQWHLYRCRQGLRRLRAWIAICQLECHCGVVGGTWWDGHHLRLLAGVLAAGPKDDQPAPRIDVQNFNDNKNNKNNQAYGKG